MDFTFSSELIILFAVVGFIAGFIDAIVGGGGMLTIPTLLTTGLPPHLTLGTNKLAATFGSFTASLTFYRKQLFSPHFWRISLVSTAIGAAIGTVWVNIVQSDILTKALPIIVTLTAIYTFFNCPKAYPDAFLPKPSKKLKYQQLLQGLTLGFYDGAAGPGTGAFWMISASMLYKMNLLLCTGVARANNFISNLTSLIVFIVLGQVDYTIGLIMGGFIFIGAWVGAHSAIKFGAKFIRPIFLFAVVALSINLLLKS